MLVKRLNMIYILRLWGGLYNDRSCGFDRPEACWLWTIDAKPFKSRPVSVWRAIAFSAGLLRSVATHLEIDTEVVER